MNNIHRATFGALLSLLMVVPPETASVNDDSDVRHD